MRIESAKILLFLFKKNFNVQSDSKKFQKAISLSDPLFGNKNCVHLQYFIIIFIVYEIKEVKKSDEKI